MLELVNAFNEKNWEAAFWADIAIRSSGDARYSSPDASGPRLNPFVKEVRKDN
jgi:hypothetical protein